MAAKNVTFIIEKGPGGQEFAASQAQAKAISESCTKAALAGLTPTDKSQLKTAIEKVKGQVSEAGDALRTRRSKVTNQLTILAEEKNEIDASSENFAKFYRLFSPAIKKCPEAAETAAASHTAIQPVVRQSLELEYKMLLARTQEGILLQRIEATQAALASLDRAAFAIS
jgi:hypothetical protein